MKYFIPFIGLFLLIKDNSELNSDVEYDPKWVLILSAIIFQVIFSAYLKHYISAP